MLGAARTLVTDENDQIPTIAAVLARTVCTAKDRRLMAHLSWTE
jgi:hypothetical protein